MDEAEDEATAVAALDTADAAGDVSVESASREGSE